MGDIYVCSYAGKLIPEVIDALNGNGPKPDAITIGGTQVFFGSPSEQLRKHEWMHVVQSARFAPRWMAGWVPIRIRAWMGVPKFWKAYIKEHTERGYVFNKFEIEARNHEALG